MRGIGGILAQAAAGNKKGFLLENAEEFGMNQVYYAGEEDTGFVSGCISPSGDYLYFIDTAEELYSIPLERKHDIGTGVDIANANANKGDYTAITGALADRGMYVDPTDTYFYVLDDTFDTLYQLTMDTPGDASSLNASYKQISSIPNDVRDLAFKTDGTKLYLGQNATQIISEYDLSTPWDISTATYNQEKELLNINGTEAITGLDFSDDGYYLYITENAAGYAFQRYALTTAWDISTVNTASLTEIPTAIVPSYGLQMVRDGNNNRLVIGDPDFLRQISLNEDGSIPPGRNQQAFDDRYKSITTNDDINSAFWHPDGTYFYCLENAAGYRIQQYDVDTPWDPTTIDLTSIVEYVSDRSHNDGGMYIIPDGTEMHIFDNDVVRIYPMSTPWDISTIGTRIDHSLSSYSTTFDYGMSYSSDGAYLLTSENGGFLNRIALSTPFDPSSAGTEMTKDFDTLLGDDALASVRCMQAYFNNNGTKMYAMYHEVPTPQTNEQGLYEFDLSTPYDITTASRNAVIGLNMLSNSFINGMYINSDGTKLSVFGNGISDGLFAHAYSYVALVNIKRTKYQEKIMYVLVDDNDNVLQYPYRYQQLVRDNPNTSFPRTMGKEALESFNMYDVIPDSYPESYDPDVQILRRDTPVKDENGIWRQSWTISNKSQTDAEKQIKYQRDLLLKDSDWIAVKAAETGVANTAWSTYRQALRDVTSQEGYPYSVTWPTQPE